MKDFVGTGRATDPLVAVRMSAVMTAKRMVAEILDVEVVKL